MVSWVVQGLSVISAALKADGWVDVVDGVGAASLAVDIDLGGSAASGLDVGVVVVEGKVFALVKDLTAWAGLLAGIVEGEVGLDVARVSSEVQAAVVANSVVKLVLEDGSVGLGGIGTANIVAAIVALVTTASEGVGVVLVEEVVTAAEALGVVEWLVVTALSVGW